MLPPQKTPVKFLIDLALSKAKPGSGTSKDFLTRRSAVKKWPDLSNVLIDVPWAVVGGVATRCYMPERSTVDLDVMIEKKNASIAEALLKKAGFSYKQELSIGGSVWLSIDGEEIDLLESQEEWLADAIKEAKNNLDPQGLPVLPFESFILLKFRSGRVQDIADVSRMLGLAPENMLGKTRKLFYELEPDSKDDLENLIILGRMELEK